MSVKYELIIMSTLLIEFFCLFLHCLTSSPDCMMRCTGQFPTNIFFPGPTRVRRQTSSTNDFWKNLTLLSSLGILISIGWLYYWSLSYWSSPSRILLPLHGWSWRVYITLFNLSSFWVLTTNAFSLQSYFRKKYYIFNLNLCLHLLLKKNAI